MFLQASVCPQWGVEVSASVHAGIPHPPRADTPRADTPPGADNPLSRHPQEQTPPRSRHPPGSRHTSPRADIPLGADTTPPLPRYAHCCGRYASYWNAFLCFLFLRGTCINFHLNSEFLFFNFSLSRSNPPFVN